MNAGTIVMRDPLAEFLGAAKGGHLGYTYADAVKLTGHSCPTVAGAYAATRDALASLYPGEVPERGAIRVELRERLEDGVAGVVASVAGLITGAAGEGGFKGLAGRFARRGLLQFGEPGAAADGFIVTSSFNFANKPTDIFVTVPGRPTRLVAKVVAHDHSRMLTLLKVDAKDLPVPTPYPKSEVQIGQWAIALGRTLDPNTDHPPSMGGGP